MTNEEFQRKMDFIVEHQAQFAVDIKNLKDVVARLLADSAQLKDIVTRLANASLNRFSDTDAKMDALIDGQIKREERTDAKMAALIDAQIKSEERTNARIEALMDSQIKSEGRIAELAAAQKALAEAQAHTDGRLNVLIDIISEGRK